jgi:hypothetical protein
MDGGANLAIETAAVVVRTIVVFAFLLVGFRIAGKRELGQTTLFDQLMKKASLETGRSISVIAREHEPRDRSVRVTGSRYAVQETVVP